HAISFSLTFRPTAFLPSMIRSTLTRMTFNASRRLAVSATAAALVAGVLAASLPAVAQAQAAAGPLMFAAPTTAMPQPPEVAARAFILQDLSTRQTLAARNADQPVEPASLTKLMTGYLVFQALQQGKLSLTQEIP